MKSEARRKVFGAGALLAVVCLCGSFIFFKDQLALRILNDRLNKALPGAVFSPESFSLWPRTLAIGNFRFRQGKGALPDWDVSGRRVHVRFDPFLLWKKDIFGVTRAQADIAALTWSLLKLEGLTFDFTKDGPMDRLSSPLEIRRFSYKDKQIEGIRGVVGLNNQSINFRDVRFTIFGAEVTCAGSLALTVATHPLDAKVRIEHIDIGEVIKFLELDKRVEGSGLYGGDVRVVLEGATLRSLEGFLTSQGGGRLRVLDTSLLERNLMADKGLNIVVENLKDYHYDIGSIRFVKEGESIRMDLLLDGDEGSRNFQIIFHS